MADVVTAAWIAQISLLWALAFRLALARSWRTQPLFSAFILIEWLRTTSLFAVFQWGTHNAYFYSFSASEPADMVALGLAGLEAGWRIAGVPYFGIASACLIAEQFLPIANYHPTGRYAWVLVALFRARSMITAASVVALTASAAWKRKIDGGTVILLAYCAIDLTEYLAIQLGSPAAVATAVVMVGQAICLAAWLALSFRTLRIAA